MEVGEGMPALVIGNAVLPTLAAPLIRLSRSAAADL